MRPLTIRERELLVSPNDGDKPWMLDLRRRALEDIERLEKTIKAMQISNERMKKQIQAAARRKQKK